MRPRERLAVWPAVMSWGGWVAFFFYSCERLSKEPAAYLSSYSKGDWLVGCFMVPAWGLWNLVCLVLSLVAVFSCARRSWKIAVLNGVFPAYVAFTFIV